MDNQIILQIVIIIAIVLVFLYFKNKNKTTNTNTQISKIVSDFMKPNLTNSVGLPYNAENLY